MRVLCSQDVSPEPWSEVEAWTYRLDRERPYGDVVVVVMADGSSPCSRCGGRHPWDQMLSREGVAPRGAMPMGWGTPAGELAREESVPDVEPFPESW